MANNAIATDLVALVDEAIAQRVQFECPAWWQSSVVNVTVPASYPADAFQALKDVAPQARFLIRLRAIADWLSVDHAAYMHGESTLEGEAYGKWIDMFVAGDRVLRFTYDFEGCIFGVKGCDGASPTGHAPVLCDACVEVRK